MDHNQIYDLFRKIDQKVDNISISSAKSEVAIENIKDDLVAIRIDLNKHIHRTDLLEREITKLRGFFFYFSVAVGFVGAAVTLLSNISAMLGK